MPATQHDLWLWVAGEEAHEEAYTHITKQKMDVWYLSQNKGYTSAYDTFFRHNPDYARIKTLNSFLVGRSDCLCLSADSYKDLEKNYVGNLF